MNTSNRVLNAFDAIVTAKLKSMAHVRRGKIVLPPTPFVRTDEVAERAGVTKSTANKWLSQFEKQLRIRSKMLLGRPAWFPLEG